MTEEMKKGYVARIASANRSELVVLIYEMMEDCLSEAKASLSVKADSEDFQKNITRFRGFLNELMGSLDFQYPVSHDLMKLYIWIDKKATEVFYSKDIGMIDHIQTLLSKLKEGFEEVAKQDNSPSVMEHAETIYAGLTYGKGSLNETVDIGNEKRGYRV